MVPSSGRARPRRVYPGACRARGRLGHSWHLLGRAPLTAGGVRLRVVTGQDLPPHTGGLSRPLAVVLLTPAARGASDLTTRKWDGVHAACGWLWVLRCVRAAGRARAHVWAQRGRHVDRGTYVGVAVVAHACVVRACTRGDPALCAAVCLSVRLDDGSGATCGVPPLWR